MNWRRISWLVILLLVFTATWAVVEIKGIYERMASMESRDSDTISQQLGVLQERIANQKERLEVLEKMALWPSDSDPMTWLTQQADDTGVQFIGVKHLPVERVSDYQSTSVNITIRGDYDPLGRFLNMLERSTNAMQINSLRIRRKEYGPEQLVMDLSLSYLRKAGKPS
jgi:hypothetical protein